MIIHPITGDLSRYPCFRRYFIIKKSIELFNDSEPCIIHRSFIIKKIALEINDYFSNKNECKYNELPEQIIEALDIKNENNYKIIVI